LSFLVERPLDVIWNGVPDVSDLLAKRPPIRETAIPKDDPEGEWTEREQGARMEYYLLVKTIQFLWQINIRISEVARMAIHYVRWKELYPDRPLPRKAKRVSFVLLVGKGVDHGVAAVLDDPLASGNLVAMALQGAYPARIQETEWAAVERLAKIHPVSDDGCSATALRPGVDMAGRISAGTAGGDRHAVNRVGRECV